MKRWIDSTDQYHYSMRTSRSLQTWRDADSALCTPVPSKTQMSGPDTTPHRIPFRIYHAERIVASWIVRLSTRSLCMITSVLRKQTSWILNPNFQDYIC